MHLYSLVYKIKLIRAENLKWDILNPDLLINLGLITRGEQALFKLEIKKKSGSSIIPISTF